MLCLVEAGMGCEGIDRVLGRRLSGENPDERRLLGNLFLPSFSYFLAL